MAKAGDNDAPDMAPDPHADKLPPVMAEVASVIGRKALFALVENYGGTRLHVPARIHAGAELAELLRMKPAQRLAERYGGDVLKVALCKEWRVYVLRDKGLTHAQIGRRLGMVEHSVWRILSGEDRKPRPPGKLRDVPALRQMRLPLD